MPSRRDFSAHGSGALGPLALTCGGKLNLGVLIHCNVLDEDGPVLVVILHVPNKKERGKVNIASRTLPGVQKIDNVMTAERIDVTPTDPW
jgi:hypothetical protein